MRVAQGQVMPDGRYIYTCGSCYGTGYHRRTGVRCPDYYDLGIARITNALKTARGARYYALLKALLSVRGKEIRDEALRIQAAQGNIERLSRQMEVLADLLLDDKIQREAYNRRYAELERGLRDARLELAREDDVDRLMMTLTDLSSAFQLMRPVNRKRALAKLFEKIEFDDEGQIQRLHLRPWARQAWGEIVFAYRLHARSFQANSAPGERMAQIWPEGMAWWLERAA